MYPGKKGFPLLKKVLEEYERRKMLVKQVLTPPFIAMADHTHQLTRSM